jgi:hypothetical protein
LVEATRIQIPLRYMRAECFAGVRLPGVLSVSVVPAAIAAIVWRN